MPERIQLSRKKGWRKPEGAVVVSRPTKWGNPSKVGSPTLVERYYPSFTRMTVVPRDRREAVVWFGLICGRDWGLPEPLWLDTPEALSELRGHDLCCWCPL